MEFPPVDKITAGAVGEPGERTFYLQARTGIELLTLLVEKQQVELLSTSILEILATVGKETGEGPGESQLELEEPLEPMWRVGRLSIGYQEDRDLMLLEAEELVPEDEEEEADEEDQEEEHVLDVPRDLGQLDPALEEPERERLRLWATREQMLALSRHGAEIAARGRPRCQFCGNPMDPEGHQCPAMNGHRGPSRT
ncbi:MAG: DUF3090 domain-containing protein [Actinomycetota bacterium]|nr:DUF3090 domain-containing protein [Actinomycetota bacterium]